MHLRDGQEQQLREVAAAGERLALAKREVRETALAALDSNVPLSRVAAAAGVQRPALYRWLDAREKEAA